MVDGPAEWRGDRNGPEYTVLEGRTEKNWIELSFDGWGGVGGNCGKEGDGFVQIAEVLTQGKDRNILSTFIL